MSGIIRNVASVRPPNSIRFGVPRVAEVRGIADAAVIGFVDGDGPAA
jgi:hypothetical protein